MIWTFEGFVLVRLGIGKAPEIRRHRVTRDGMRMGDGTTAHLAKIRSDAMVDIPQISASEVEIIYAYRQGAEAALGGAHAFSCPYLDDLENAVKYAAWMEGFGGHKSK